MMKEHHMKMMKRGEEIEVTIRTLCTICDHLSDSQSRITLLKTPWLDLLSLQEVVESSRSLRERQQPTTSTTIPTLISKAKSVPQYPTKRYDAEITSYHLGTTSDNTSSIIPNPFLLPCRYPRFTTSKCWKRYTQQDCVRPFPTKHYIACAWWLCGEQLRWKTRWMHLMRWAYLMLVNCR